VWGRGYVMHDPVKAVIQLTPRLRLPAEDRTGQLAVRQLNDVKRKVRPSLATMNRHSTSGAAKQNRVVVPSLDM